PNLDRRCLSLSRALAKSANVVFAKMAVKHLDADDLRKSAERFLFNRPIFDQPVEQSRAQIPDSGLDFARSAAGFGEVKLSPMHAALIAASVGNAGVAMEPSVLDSVNGEPVEPTGSMRLLNPETAATLRDMMKLTVSQGTATPVFRDRHRNVLGDIEVAGKTGSLCRTAKAAILAVRRQVAFEFREIDIGWSGELYEEHKHDIPVVEIDGKRAFKHRVDPAALKERLR